MRARLAIWAVLAAAALGPWPPAAGQTPAAGEGAAPAAPAAPAADGQPLLHHREELVVKDTADLLPAATGITRLPIPLQQLPASVDVIGAPLLEQQDARVLGDALRDASGFAIHTESGVADFFVVRGFDSETSAQVLTDGAPEPVTTFYQLYNADRVEALKGPASVFFGGNPLAGAVNIVRKQPVAEDFAQVAGMGGAFGTRQGTVDVNWGAPDSGLGMRLNGLWGDTDGWRDGRGGRVGALNPTLAWRAGEEGSVVLSVERVESTYNPDAGLPLVGNRVADVPADRSYQSPFDRSDQTLDRFQLDWQEKLGGFTFHDKAYYRELSWRSDGTLFDGVFPADLGRLVVGRTLVLLDDRQALWGNQLEAGLDASTGPLRHQLLAGLELSRRDDTFTLNVGLLPPIDLLAPVETAQGPVPLIPGQSSAGDTRMLIAAPYLLDRVGIGEHWQLLLGGRFDRLDYHDPVNATVRHDSQLSPLAGLTWSPAAAWSLYAQAGRGFAPPSTRVTGPALPETGSQQEAGIKGSLLGGRLRTTLAVYDLTRRNEAIPGANGFVEQTGSQRSRGVEAEVAAARLRDWDLLVAYAYDRAVFTRFAESVLVSEQPPTVEVFDRTGNTAPLAPAHLLTLWATRHLPRGVELSAGGRYVSRQFIAADNVFAIPGAATADAALALPLGPARVRVELRNLTNERSYTRGLGTGSVIPTAGFAAYAGVEMRWQPPARGAGAHP